MMRRMATVTNETWSAVDDYFIDLLAPEDDALRAAREASDAAKLPAINVTAPQGKLLQLLALACGAKRILEIGTLAGYSAIWLARALPPGGRLVTLESVAKHAEVARANLARAGLADRVEVKLGAALSTLPTLSAPFDFIFIDADKEAYVEYLAASIALSRPGTLIVADNVVRDGAILDPDSPDARVQGIRRFNLALAAERRITATAIQTVGGKGYDGFAVARVL